MGNWRMKDLVGRPILAASRLSGGFFGFSLSGIPLAGLDWAHFKHSGTDHPQNG
jgi:hypothetical protein